MTVSVNDCVAFGSTPLDAVIVSRYIPPVPAAGVPPRVAVPLPLFVKVTPVGSAPVSLIVEAVGVPLVVIVNVPALPAVNVVALVLVTAGDPGGADSPYELSPQQAKVPSLLTPQVW